MSFLPVARFLFSLRSLRSLRLLRAGLTLIAIALWQVAGFRVASAASAPTSLGPQPTSDEEKEICLAETVRGGSMSDDAIILAQARARKLPQKAEEWVRVGWEWVRKART